MREAAPVRSGDPARGADAPQSPAVSTPRGPGRRARLALFAVVALLSLAPVALVRYPPVTDLPQQVAQLPLLAEALGSGADRYLVQWTAPNKIAYPLLAAGWFVGGAEHGARIGLGLCLIASLAGVHLLGGVFDRPLAHVALASAFVWSICLYWGFFGFMLGTPALALWLRELARPRERARRVASFVPGAAAALLLYESHVLWLAAAGGLLVLFVVARLTTWRRALVLAAALVPFVAAAWAWNWTTASWRVEDRVLWDVPIVQRLTSIRLWLHEPFGGVQGLLEPTYVTAVLLWGILALVAHRRSPRFGLEPALALASAATLLAIVVLPDRVDEALFFSMRWGHVAAVLGVLALPPPPLRPRLALAVALTALSAFVGATAAAWVDFDRNDAYGFAACRRAVPSGSRLLGLDFVHRDDVFFGRTTNQFAAYVRLDRPVELAFSFAEHRSSLVVERRLPRPIRWTRKLEHRPDLATANDIAQFDLVLVRAPQPQRAALRAKFPRLLEVAGEGEWRLFRVGVSAGETR